jgi:hypothetical protein
MLDMNSQENAKNTPQQFHSYFNSASQKIRAIYVTRDYHKQRGQTLQSFSGAFYQHVWPVILD